MTRGHNYPWRKLWNQDTDAFAALPDDVQDTGFGLLKRSRGDGQVAVSHDDDTWAQAVLDKCTIGRASPTYRGALPSHLRQLFAAGFMEIRNGNQIYIRYFEEDQAYRAKVRASANPHSSLVPRGLLPRGDRPSDGFYDTHKDHAYGVPKERCERGADISHHKLPDGNALKTKDVAKQITPGFTLQERDAMEIEYFDRYHRSPPSDDDYVSSEFFGQDTTPLVSELSRETLDEHVQGITRKSECLPSGSKEGSELEEIHLDLLRQGDPISLEALSIILQFEEVGDVRSWDLVRSKVEGRKWSRENRVYLLKAQEISAQRIFEEATQKVAKK